MTAYTLTSPLVIGPRLMPALLVAQGTDTYGTISGEIDSYDGERFVLRYVIDTSGHVFERADVRSAVCYPDSVNPSDVLRSMMGALVSFLGAEAEAYAGSGNMGANEPADGWMFSPEIAEWAYLNADELSMLRDEIEGEEY